MTAGEDSDASEAAADESSDAPSKDASRSRFDAFLERLDERDVRRGDLESDDSDPHSQDEAEGWVWGLPKKASERDPSGESANDLDREPAADSEPPPRPERTTESEREESDRPHPADDEDRIWNVTNDERDETERELPTSDVERPDDDSTIEPPVSSTEDGATESDERDEPSESELQDRWAVLGAELERDGEETSEKPTVRRARSEGTSGAERPLSVRERDADDRERGDTSTSPRPSSTATVDANGWSELERARAAESVLVLGPTGEPISKAICSKFLIGEEGSRDVLFVTFDESPDDRIDVCHRSDEWTGGEIGIIEVGRGRRNASVTSTISGGGAVGSITVRQVSKPGDLSKLGIVITQMLAEFDETPRQTVLCFHTLSALHSQVGTKTLFRFLNTLQGRLRSANAVGHYHMDPDLHDEIVIETLRPLFDSVVRYSADGALEIE